MKAVKIFSLVMVPQAGQYLVTLEEVDGTRLLPIWIGPMEGVSIGAVLQKQEFPRPLTHDLLVTIIRECKASIERVVITDLKEDTFYARIMLKQGNDEYHIDARPSDSIAIAIRVQAPIFVEEMVFEKCPKIEKPISDEEVKKFTRVLENLTPEDFFKNTGPKDG